ncbi:MAG TPA: hypothetical protein VG326_14145 [Tepidisphaeraceae bacterium]|jgi:hypothetical protein|nr:hypothetical protein [Tepidisphaeraceae bacterium]
MNTAVPPVSPALTCPVCRARFRGASVCLRCGTDLSLLMRAAASAWAARQQSREALRSGNLRQALRLIARATQLHHIDAAP